MSFLGIITSWGIAAAPSLVIDSDRAVSGFVLHQAQASKDLIGDGVSCMQAGEDN